MSKERARRRAAREQETALRSAARAAERERRERREARRRALTRRLPKGGRGRQSGVLAQRKRSRMTVMLVLLLFLQVIVWVARPEWQARMVALALTLLVFPLLAAFVV